MAKSFKKTATTTSAPPKPTSERDFFDFLEDSTTDSATQQPIEKEVVAELPRVDKLLPSSDTGKVVIPSDSDVAREPISLPEQSAPDAGPRRAVAAKPGASSPRHRAVTEQPIQPVSEPGALVASLAPVVPPVSIPGLPTAENSSGVRQTFVVGAEYLEQLRDFVHAQRTAGAYWYSQRQAIEEALALLFAAHDPVTQRPDHIQVREQQRRARIQQGRRTGQTPKDSPNLS